MRLFGLLLDWLSKGVILVAGAAPVALVAMTGWAVFGRYVLNDTPSWVERAAALCILFIALPVAAVGVRERFHLSVLGLREALPAPAQRVVAIGCDLLVGLFGLAMAIHSKELADLVMRFRIPLLGISQAWTCVPLILCGWLIVLFAIEQLLQDILHRDAPGRRGVKAALPE
jgi:TRAP-type C4-dicarboxylate transport system permease small subunit